MSTLSHQAGRAVEFTGSAVSRSVDEQHPSIVPSEAGQHAPLSFKE